MNNVVQLKLVKNGMVTGSPQELVQAIKNKVGELNNLITDGIAMNVETRLEVMEAHVIEHSVVQSVLNVKIAVIQ